MKFDFATFSTVARGAFFKEFDNFCTCGDVTPSPVLETGFGMACLAFLRELKEALFEEFKNTSESKEVSVNEFDAICAETCKKATEGMDNLLIRIGMVGVLANITKEIKRYYGMFNNTEEE